MRRTLFCAIILFFLAGLLFGSAAYSSNTRQAKPDPRESYVDVAPIFDNSCLMCHGGPLAASGLRLDSYENIMAGSRNGKVVLPGNPQGSILIKRIKGVIGRRMPLYGVPFLTESQTAIIEKWIGEGAPL